VSVRRLLGLVWWYLREVIGEAEYDRDYNRFVERHRCAHPGAPVPSRRDFERQRGAPGPPEARCC
jgi:uncharacterized short protein YbdD (DUF466 family)